MGQYRAQKRYKLVRSIKGNWHLWWQISFSKKYACAYMKYEIEIRSSKGLDLACNIYEKKKSFAKEELLIMQYLWEKEILVREQLFHHAIESKTHDHFRCKTFIRFTRDLNNNMEVLGAKKILYSPSSSTMHMEWDSCQTSEVFTSKIF